MPWRAQSGSAPWSDVTDILLADASAEVIQACADALWADASAPQGAAYMPMDLSVSVGDEIRCLVGAELVRGEVTAVEHVVREGQALTRVELRIFEA